MAATLLAPRRPAQTPDPYSTGSTVAAGPGWPGQAGTLPSPPAGNRNPWLLLAVAALVVVAVLGGLGIWLSTRRADNPAPAGAGQKTTTATTTPATTTTYTFSAKGQTEDHGVNLQFPRMQLPT